MPELIWLFKFELFSSVRVNCWQKNRVRRNRESLRERPKDRTPTGRIWVGVRSLGLVSSEGPQKFPYLWGLFFPKPGLNYGDYK